MTAESSGDGGGPNLLAGVPGGPAAPAGDPAKLDELRALLLDMRDRQVEMQERLAALETATASERPEPVTRVELDGWGEALLEKLGEAAPTESGTDTAAIVEHAERTAAAAERIDAGLERTAERFSAEVAGVEKWLSEDRSSIRAPMTGIESAAGRIEAGLGEFRKRADSRFNDIASVAYDTREMVRKLQFDWRIFLAPWAIGMFIAGAVFATSMRIASRLL